MLPKNVRRIAWGCVVCCVAGGWLPTTARAQPQSAHNILINRVSEKTSQLALTEKESRLLQLDARIKTVDGFDPTIVKITTVDNFHQVRVLALTPGFTSVILVDEHGQSFTIEILVSGDVKQLEAVIRKAAPGSSVQALKVKDNVLLLGWVDQPAEATKIVELAEQFHPKVLNYLQVSGIQTIMLRVKMMEAQRSKIRSLGFNFLQLREHSYVTSLPGPVVPFANGLPPAAFGNPFGGLTGPASVSINPAAATAMFGLVAADNAFQGFIEALKTENLLTILAEPTLITVNGRPANFLSGGQFPVPVPQGLGTVSVVYKPFGVQLEFVPTVIGNGRLRMQVRPEVSEKDLSNTLTVSGITVPSLTTRSVNTEVEMNFGETLVIAGLISNRVQATTQKVPFLGELPWVGAAFRRVRHDENETELLVLVTPELASPTDESQLPDGPGRNTVVPTDRELYFNGYLETPRYCPDPEPDVSHIAPHWQAPPASHTGGAPAPAPYGAAPPVPAPGVVDAAPESLPAARNAANPPVEGQVEPLLPGEPAAEDASAAGANPMSSRGSRKHRGGIRQASGVSRDAAPPPSGPAAKRRPPTAGPARSLTPSARPAPRPGLIAP